MNNGLSTEETVSLYRPTGLDELELVRQSGYTKWPARLPGQPIFYPVTEICEGNRDRMECKGWESRLCDTLQCQKVIYEAI